MSKAYKCDRCGKYYDENVKHTNPYKVLDCLHLVGIHIIDELENSAIEYDLCDDCLTAFKKFMKEK